MAEKVERSVMLSKETAGALTRYAKRNHISGSEAIRRFVEKGLNMDSYTSEQEVIRTYIKSELAADIKPYMERIIKMQAKCVRNSAAALMAGVHVLADSYINEIEPEQILANAFRLAAKVTKEQERSFENYSAEAHAWLSGDCTQTNDCLGATPCRTRKEQQT